MIRIANRQKKARVPAAKVRRLARRLLGERALSLAFVTDAEIRRLNRRFLGHDRPTDVLSFRLDGGPRPRGGFLGEVVVSAETASREARLRRLPVEEEILRYVAHGILHLLGYDDRRPRDRARMWDRQEGELRKLSGEA
jgi:probable rRNA maturation factor